MQNSVICQEMNISYVFVSAGAVELIKLQSVDVTALCVHPACVTSITLTSLRPEAATRGSNSNNPELNEASILINVSGRLLMVQHEADSNSQHPDNNANREHLVRIIFHFSEIK